MRCDVCGARTIQMYEFIGTATLCRFHWLMACELETEPDGRPTLDAVRVVIDCADRKEPVLV